MITPLDYGLTSEQLEKARQFFREVEKIKRFETRRDIAKAQRLKDKLSVEEKIKLLNTAYSDIPKEYIAGMTKRPQVFNSVHMEHPHMSGQHESFGARLLRTRDALGLSRDELMNICNKYASLFDDNEVRAGAGRHGQRTRITKLDLRNYEDFNVTPKRDKLTVIAKALGVDVAYLAGYGEPTFKSANQFITARYKKNGAKKRYAKYTKDEYAPFTPKKKVDDV